MDELTATVESAPSLRIDNLSKSFGRAQVLHQISLEIAGGEFVGLVGPNGAGKSTLIKVLDGLYSPSQGRIYIDGSEVESLGAHPDVAFIHQDLGLIDTLSIADNMRLGQQSISMIGPILDRRAERRAAEDALRKIGMNAQATALVGDLSPGEKTLVAIARAFARGARILFVDEATSTLTGPDAQRVVDTLARSAANGATVIMVSHRLSEILHSTQRIIVLLDGSIAFDRSTTGMGRSELVALLASHERSAAEEDVLPAIDGQTAGVVQRFVGDPVLTLTEACAGKAGPVTMTVNAGEIVGLTGTPGSGLHDLGFMAHGSIRLRSGTRVLPARSKSALVPPHRESQGGFNMLSTRTNLTISSLARWMSITGLIRGNVERRASIDTTRSLDVRPPDIETEFGVLSGGNKQKVIFGRALLRKPNIFVLCEPTRGVDVDARNDIYKLIRKLPDERTGVLVISSDPEDLFAVCERVAVVGNGVTSDFRDVGKLTEQDLESML